MKNELLKFLHEDLAPDAKAHIDENSSLFAARILDSMCLMELVSFVEERFQVKVRPMDLVFENFDTVSNMVRFVERQRGQIASSPAASPTSESLKGL